MTKFNWENADRSTPDPSQVNRDNRIPVVRDNPIIADLGTLNFIEQALMRIEYSGEILVLINDGNRDIEEFLPNIRQTKMYIRDYQMRCTIESARDLRIQVFRGTEV